MQTLKIITAVLLMSSAALAQNTTQAVPQATQQPAASTSTTQTQTYQAVPRSTTGPVYRPAGQSAQGVPAGQIPRANAAQDAGLSTPARAVAPVGTQEIYEQSSVEQDPVDVQTITDPQTGQPVVNTGQTQQYINSQSTTTQSTQSVNTGQVPKAYTNTTTQLPFSQYQPKPTGRIAPAGVTPNSAPSRGVR